MVLGVRPFVHLSCGECSLPMYAPYDPENGKHGTVKCVNPKCEEFMVAYVWPEVELKRAAAPRGVEAPRSGGLGERPAPYGFGSL